MSIASLHRLFFYITLVCIPVQLGYHFWPSWALVLGRRVDFLSPTLYFTDLSIGATLFLWILSQWVHLLERKQLFIQSKTVIAGVVCLLFASINIYFSFSPFESLYRWIKLFELGLFGFYIVKTNVHGKTIAKMLVLGAFFASVVAIAQFFLQHSLGGLFWFFGERQFDISTSGIARVSACHYIPFGLAPCKEVLRSYATFPHPNVLAGFLVTVFTVSAPLFFLKTGNTIKSMEQRFLMAVFICMAFALVVTFTRSAWIILCLVSLLYFFSQKRRFFFSLFLLGVIASIFVFLLNPQEESVVVRQQLMSAGLSMWLDQKIFGVGLGNFVSVLPESLPRKIIYYVQPMHTIYGLWFVETGVAGVIFLLAFCILTFRHIIQMLRFIYAHQEVSIPYVLPVIALLLFGLTDHWLLTLHQGQLLFVVTMGFSIQALRSL